MHRLKILVVASMAVFALAALVSASASAAMVLPEFTTKTGWTGTSGAGKLTTASGNEIKCGAGTNSGTAENNKEGQFSITFTKCKSEKPIAGVSCNSKGDAAETILTGGTWHLVLTTISGVDKHLEWLLVKPLTVECSITSFAITGNLLGEVTPANTSTKSYALKVAVPVAKEQEFTTFENNNGEAVTASLKSGSEAAYEESANNVFTTEKATTIIN
jgi:hypothetical protein